MITHVLIKKDILSSIIVNGYKGCCDRVKEKLKILIGCVPSNGPEDICLVFSDGNKDDEGEIPNSKSNERFPINKQRLRIQNCETKKIEE